MELVFTKSAPVCWIFIEPEPKAVVRSGEESGIVHRSDPGCS